MEAGNWRGEGVDKEVEEQREALWNNVLSLCGAPASSWFGLSLWEFPCEKEAADEAVHKLHGT